MSLRSRLALQFSLEGIMFLLMNGNLSHRRKETQVMTFIETGGRRSNANMCHYIGQMRDHAKVTTTIITRKEKTRSVFMLKFTTLLNKR